MVSKRKNNLCFLCYKPASSKKNRTNQIKQSSEGNFLLLLLHHLELKPKSEALKNEFLCCKDCSMLGNSFCDLYLQLDSIQIQVNSKLKSIHDAMLSAGRIPSRVVAFRTQFETNQDERDPSQKIFSEITKARNNLIKSCGLKLSLEADKPKVPEIATRISEMSDEPAEIKINVENHEVDSQNCGDYDSEDYVEVQDLHNGHDFEQIFHPNQDQPFDEADSEMCVEYPEIAVPQQDPLGIETREEQPPQQDSLPNINMNIPNVLKCSFEGCRRLFKERKFLNHHIKIRHTPNMPLMECSKCGKKFPEIGRLNQHLRFVHKIEFERLKNLNNKKHHCVICQRKYGSSKDVYSHIRKKHPDVNESEIVCCCGKTPKKGRPPRK